MTGTVLVINAGSSSLKFSVFDASAKGEPLLLFKGLVERINTRPHLSVRDADNTVLADAELDTAQGLGHDGAIAAVAAWLGTAGNRGPVVAAGHRVAHGGIDLVAPVVVDEKLLLRLQALVPLVPLHQPANLAPMRALRARLPELPQVACFDTAFHHGHSEIVDRFALPERFYRDGIRRYGFHGLSYEYIAHELPSVAPGIAAGRVIVAHLGSGASLCALRGGRSVDSTMTFSALDGLPMGTRCGAIDPGVLLFLIRERSMTVDDVESLLYRECGLLGLSGVSNDMRDLSKSGAPAARLAIDYFVHHVCRELGALAAELGGLDGIVFTAGIGENAANIRELICARASWLGIDLDPAANSTGGPCITAPASPVSVWVIPTNEELVIARHTLGLIKSPPRRVH